VTLRTLKIVPSGASNTPPISLVWITFPMRGCLGVSLSVQWVHSQPFTRLQGPPSFGMWPGSGAGSLAKATAAPTDPTAQCYALLSAGTASPITLTPTRPPTTGAPVTSQPTSHAPVTIQPTSHSPITTSPTSHAPVTQGPSTLAPVTTAPTSHSPISALPTSHAPITITTAPTSHVPVITTGSPTTHAPVTTAPTSHTPVTQNPTTHAPVTQHPTSLAPVTGSPTSLAPVTTSLTSHAPITAAPTSHAPTNSRATTSCPSGQMCNGGRCHGAGSFRITLAWTGSSTQINFCVSCCILSQSNSPYPISFCLFSLALR
jgi:hypothetical protein